MLQASVLAAAALFIFGGASAGACALAPPALAALVALAVRRRHRRAARAASLVSTLTVSDEYEKRSTVDTHARHDRQRLRSEILGFVAEVRGPGAERGRVVGTVSVAEHSGAHRCGWLHGLAVDAR